MVKANTITGDVINTLPSRNYCQCLKYIPNSDSFSYIRYISLLPLIWCCSKYPKVKNVQCVSSIPFSPLLVQILLYCSGLLLCRGKLQL